ALLLSPFVGQKLGTFVSSENAQDLAVLTELIESGKVTPVIDRTYPLSQVPAAIRHVQEGQAQGKGVINEARSGAPFGGLRDLPAGRRERIANDGRLSRIVTVRLEHRRAGSADLRGY